MTHKEQPQEELPPPLMDSQQFDNIFSRDREEERDYERTGDHGDDNANHGNQAEDENANQAW